MKYGLHSQRARSPSAKSEVPAQRREVRVTTIFHSVTESHACTYRCMRLSQECACGCRGADIVRGVLRLSGCGMALRNVVSWWGLGRRGVTHDNELQNAASMQPRMKLPSLGCIHLPAPDTLPAPSAPPTPG